VEKTSITCLKTRKWKEMQRKMNLRLGNTSPKPDKTNPCGTKIEERKMHKKVHLRPLITSKRRQKTRRAKEMPGKLKLRLGNTSPKPDKINRQEQEMQR
jgi:hypothetical protein